MAFGRTSLELFSKHRRVANLTIRIPNCRPTQSQHFTTNLAHVDNKTNSSLPLWQVPFFFLAGKSQGLTFGFSVRRVFFPSGKVNIAMENPPFLMGIYRETMGGYSSAMWLRVRWSQTSFLKAERWWKLLRRVGKHRLKAKELFMFLRSSIQAGCGMWDVGCELGEEGCELWVMGWWVAMGDASKVFRPPPMTAIPKIEPFLIVHRNKNWRPYFHDQDTSIFFGHKFDLLIPAIWYVNLVFLVGQDFIWWV